MQLAPPRPTGPAPADVAAALAAARDTLGHRPAVTVLGADRRDEQGVASLAQWAAKGAHLLELDLLLEPGDRIVLDLDPGWPLAAVALAAWWAGLAVSLEGEGAVAVLQEGRPASAAEEILWIGDTVDGMPAGEVPGEAWSSAVQAFPDQPPPPRAAPDLAALVTPERTFTQAELLTAAASMAAEGTVGIAPDHALRPELLVAAIAIRPLLAGRPTVVLRDGVAASAADGEKVSTWL